MNLRLCTFVFSLGVLSLGAQIFSSSVFAKNNEIDPSFCETPNLSEIISGQIADTGFEQAVYGDSGNCLSIVGQYTYGHVVDKHFYGRFLDFGYQVYYVRDTYHGGEGANDYILDNRCRLVCELFGWSD